MVRDVILLSAMERMCLRAVAYWRRCMSQLQWRLAWRNTIMLWTDF